MRRLIVLAAVLTITAARPETYREKEDFQYSRSSSDEGSKSGYYGAQRGNMGGNYERAHNMDTLAQHQMSGAVRQVQGELGDGANQRSGSVFTAANSQGMYGSGRYDLSSLQGRNFQEGVSYDTAAHSQSSLSSHNSGSMGQLHTSVNHGAYDSSNAYDSRYRGYNSARNSNQMLYANNQHQSAHDLQLANQHHSADDLQLANQQQTRYESHGSGYNAQSGYHKESGYNQANYDSSNRYGSNVHNRLVGAGTPVRVVVRPGTMVTIPVAAQTYDASQSSSAFDRNAINTEAEALSGHDEHTAYRPSNKGKHYESSYSYRKEWEKHDTQPAGVPLAIPTVNPYPKNSELYEDAQTHSSGHQQAASSVDSHNSQVDSRQSSYNVKSASSSQSRHQAGYNAQHHSTASNADSSAYRTGEYNNAALNQLLNSQVEDISSKPKSYQSSYSYHKSWERQGDPYVIIPTNTDSSAAQKLVTSQHGAYGDTRQYGSHYHYGNQKSYIKTGDVDCDCDENGHIRVARSVDFENQQQEDLTQQTQSQWEDFSQHSQNLEDLGQQTQNLELTQQSQHNWDKVEDLGQQTQNLEFTQQNQNKWDKFEDLTQQTQNQWSPQTTGQQTEQLGLQVEDLGQQTQNQWSQQETEHKNNWDNLELEPQSQTGTLQIKNKDITKPMPHTVQNEESSKPNHSMNTGSNWNIHISNIDKGKDAIHPVFKQEFQGATMTDLNNWYKEQFSQNLGQQVQDIIWNMNSNSQQTQSNHFYGYNSYDKHTMGLMPQNPGMYNKFDNAENNNNYQPNWHVTEQSNINPKLDSSNSFQLHNSHSLSNIWDKLDTIEIQSQRGQDLNVDKPAPIDFHYAVNKNVDESPRTEKSPIEKPETTTSKLSSTTKPTIKPKDNVNDIYKVEPQDFGRGDIGPEDVLNIVTTSRPQSTTIIIQSEQITPLNSGNNYKQHSTNFKPQRNNSEQQLKNLEDFSNFEQQSTNFEQQSTNFEQQSTNFEQQTTNLEQQTTNLEDLSNFKPHSTNFDQQSTNFEQQHLPKQQQSSNFEQQSNNFDQQTTNMEQQSTNLDLSNFKPHSNNFEQQSTNFEQQHLPTQQQSSNFEQQSNNFDQQTTNLEQQSTNLEDFSSFKPHSTNFEQQHLPKQQQSSNFEQQSNNFDQQTTNMEQQSTNLDLSNFKPHSNNFEQQSTNFEQQHLPTQTQSSNFEQQSNNFDQQTTNMEQQSTNLDLSNFKPHSNNFEQQSTNFEQQHLPTQQQSSNFEQQSNNFDQQTTNLEQQSTNLEDFSSFKPHSTNFEQQHLPKQQQSSNFEQQSNNFDQQTTNLEQQSTNLEDFSNFKPHSSNFEQQHLPTQQQLPSVVEHIVHTEHQTDNMNEHANNFKHQSDNFEQQAAMFEQQSEHQDKDFLQQSLPSHKNKDIQIEEVVEKQVSIPLYNDQGHWERKDEEFTQHERSDNLNQPMHKELDQKDLQQSQNVGMFSPEHDIPENIDQQKNSELVIPLEPAVTQSSTETGTENSFWKSVSNKFSRAKDKVKSWFSK